MKLSNLIRKKTRPFCSAVIVAAGSSERMGEDKLMLPLDGVPVLVRSIQAFDSSPLIDEIIVVTQSAKIVPVSQLCADYGIKKVTKILTGGETRVISALAGLSEIDDRAKLAAIHDGARPLVTHEVIEKALHCAALNKAAAPAVPLKDTVKLVKDGAVVRTLERSSLAAVQTPQVFWPDIIKGALTDAMNRGRDITDDCSAVEAMGVPVFIIEGSYENIKITTPEDIAAAEAILERRGHK